MATTKDKRKVSGPGKTCVSCRNGKVKCKRPDQADGLPLPDCNRCVQKHRVCVVYVEDKRKNDTQRRQVTAKRAEMEKTCVGFLTLFAILHYFDGVLPRHIARMHLESLLDVVPKICSLTAVSEFRARLGFLESKDHPLAEQAKKICDLVVDSQDEVPAGGSKLEKVRQCTRQRARGACRLYAAFSRLLFRYVQALMDFEYQGEVQRDLAELHFEISISDENAIAFVYNGTKEELDRVLESIETGMELQETPSKGRLEKAQTEAMAVYGTSVCRGVTGLRFENGVVVDCVGETSKKNTTGAQPTLLPTLPLLFNQPSPNPVPPLTIRLFSTRKLPPVPPLTIRFWSTTIQVQMLKSPRLRTWTTTV
ncbi:hypothetical protein V8F20_008409 [Naviculisporaceae sp. PSN 640]